MIQVMYVSERALLTNEKDIQEILDTARHKNHQNDITGLLACLPNNFIQVLEGNRDEVHKLLEDIKRDNRHNAVEVLYEEAIKHRAFPLWSMAHFDLDDRFGDSFKVLEMAAKSNSRKTAQIEGVMLILKGLKPL